MSTQPERTYRYTTGEGTKCGDCNWETLALYVLVPSQVVADQLLSNSYGCAKCGILEWEHGRLVGFQGDDPATATPILEGPHLDHDFEERTEADGTGLCGESMPQCWRSLNERRCL